MIPELPEQFHSKKFELLRYGRNEILKQSTSYFTPNFENIIEEKESLRDLGVQMSSDASFSIHVEGVCSKVKQKSSWILRTFSNRKSWFLKFMWKSLVQGHIDYCSQLYFPTSPQKWRKLKIYRKFTPKSSQISNISTTGKGFSPWNSYHRKDEWKGTDVSISGK